MTSAKTPWQPLIRFVDDDPVQRQAMQYMLEPEGYEVCCYENAREFLSSDTPSRPGLCILDLQMPGMNGLELQKLMTERGYQLPVIFLSAHGSLQKAVLAMKQGSVDFLEKPVKIDELLKLIAQILEKERIRCSTSVRPQDASERLKRLTERELKISRLLAQDLSKRVIAERLGVAIKTVDNQVRTIYLKLGVHSQKELSELLRSADQH